MSPGSHISGEFVWAKLSGGLHWAAPGQRLIKLCLISPVAGAQLPGAWALCSPSQGLGRRWQWQKWNTLRSSYSTAGTGHLSLTLKLCQIQKKCTEPNPAFERVSAFLAEIFQPAFLRMWQSFLTRPLILICFHITNTNQKLCKAQLFWMHVTSKNVSGISTTIC